MIYVNKTTSEIQFGYYSIDLVKYTGDMWIRFVYNRHEISLKSNINFDQIKDNFIDLGDADIIIKKNLIRILLDNYRLISIKLKNFLEI